MTPDVSTRCLSAAHHFAVFGVCYRGVDRSDPPNDDSALPPQVSMRRATSIAFGENQLFPGLFGLSPLSTAHPLVLQHQWVRASSGCYPTFTLAMDRSPGFGSTSSNSSPLSDSVSLRLPYSVKLATERKSLTHYTKGTQSLCCQSSHCLYACGFRFYFTPLAGVLFAFPSRYWFAIGRSRVFSLGGWSPHLQTGFHVSRPTCWCA